MASTHTPTLPLCVRAHVAVNGRIIATGGGGLMAAAAATLPDIIYDDEDAMIKTISESFFVMQDCIDRFYYFMRWW